MEDSDEIIKQIFGAANKACAGHLTEPKDVDKDNEIKFSEFIQNRFGKDIHDLSETTQLRIKIIEDYLLNLPEINLDLDLCFDDTNKKPPVVINLTRYDLRRDHWDRPLNEITIYCFDGSRLSREDINGATKIIFTDKNNEMKILKRSRFDVTLLDRFRRLNIINHKI